MGPVGCRQEVYVELASAVVVPSELCLCGSV